MNEGGFSWGSLLNKAVDVGGAVLTSKIDKPISEEVPTNQNTNADSSAQAAIVAQTSTVPDIRKYAPYLIGGGLLLVGVFFVIALKNAK